MIKVYTGLKGMAVSLFFIAGVVLTISVFFWGISKVIQLFLPLLVVLSYLLIIVFLLGILPATFFKDLRPALYVYSTVMSHALGVAVWMMSFFYVFKALGILGMFLVFLFQFLAPVAMAVAILQSSWAFAGHLALWISFTYGMRFYSQWLLNLNLRDPEKSRIIDVDAIEVRDH